ncbi:MAG: hypothetical protein DYG94_02940 [Leptolyngbya sp. PLA3]|nr:hypothetical protein [Leptolyngbya sp. PL-A3]
MLAANLFGLMAGGNPALADWRLVHNEGIVDDPVFIVERVYDSDLPGAVWNIVIIAFVKNNTTWGTLSLTASGDDSIHECRVTVYSQSGSTPRYAALGISRDPNATIPAIEYVQRTTWSDADLSVTVHGLTQFGGYGVDKIEADVIGDCWGSGDFIGSIDTTVDGGSGALTEQVGHVRFGGDIRGSIQCMGSGGQIFTVESTDGSIGTSTAAAVIKAYSVIHNIEAYGDIYANIDVGSDPGVSAGNLVRVNATTGGVHGVIRAGKLHYVDPTSGVFAAGDLDSSFTLSDDIHTPIVVGGDLDGDITCAANLSGAGSWDGRIEIGGDLNGDITLAAGGLQGQIAVNASDASYDWLGDVTIGTTTLGPGESGDNEAPYYGVPKGSIGGGAVGVVPFNFHRNDSAPDHDSIVTTGALSTVTIEHYGPVVLGTSPGVRVYEASWALPYPYTSHADVPLCYQTGGGDYWTEMTGLTISASGRMVSITGTFTPGHAYQVITDGLVCDVDGSPAVLYHGYALDPSDTGAIAWTGAWDADANGGAGAWCANLPQSHGYGFVIPSKYDRNINMALENGDIDTWLVEPVDLNEDGAADSIDLVELVDAVVNGEE